MDHLKRTVSSGHTWTHTRRIIKDTETDFSNSNNNFGELHTEEKSSELVNLEIQPVQYIEKAFK